MPCSHVANGVDIIVAQGYEAGGHTGEIASMVLTPDIVDAVGPDVPVLGAGGIGSGRQIAASLALGAQGVWTGSIWLGTEEYRNLAGNAGWETAFLRATSSDTVRTRIYTGKPARLLKSKWTEAWNEEDAPTPLPMPLQNLLVADAHNRINAAGDPEVVSMPVGQIVGRMNEVRPVAEVMADLVAEFETTVKRLDGIAGNLTWSGLPPGPRLGAGHRRFGPTVALGRRRTGEAGVEPLLHPVEVGELAAGVQVLPLMTSDQVPLLMPGGLRVPAVARPVAGSMLARNGRAMSCWLKRREVPADVDLGRRDRDRVRVAAHLPLSRSRCWTPPAGRRR